MTVLRRGVLIIWDFKIQSICHNKSKNFDFSLIVPRFMKGIDAVTTVGYF